MTVDVSGAGAVITAFAPDRHLVAVAGGAAAQVERVYVIDNTPRGMRSDVREELSGLDRVEVLGGDGNRGLAAALNRGLAACIEAGLDLAFMLDQDSSPPAELVASLRGHLADPRVAAVGPAPWDARRAAFIDPRTRWRAPLAERPAIITSGMLLRVEGAMSIGGFREDFFVDGVDQDLCLRLRAAGHRVLQDRRVQFPHELGMRSTHGFLGVGVTASHHPTWRLYWVFRNGLILAREHWRAEPLWTLANLLIMARWLLVTALFEPPRRARLKAIAAGRRDARAGALDPRYLPPGAVGIPVHAGENIRP
jgi:rhamnosyltransferase